MVRTSILSLACVALGASAAFFPSSQGEASAPEAVRVFVVRHADRDGKRDALTQAGAARALALRNFVLRQGVSTVYSTDTPRTRATGAPTAAALGVKIESYGKKLEPRWFEEVARRHAGGAILIVGHSNTVLSIVRGFGGRSSVKIGHDDYRHIFALQVRAGDFARTQVIDLAYGARDGAERRAASSRPASRAAGRPTSRPKVKR